MKQFFFTLLLLVVGVSAATSQLMITGVYDGPLSGGTPKGVELYVTQNIADLSVYGLSSANNGGGTTAPNPEFTFPAVAATAGTFIYVATEAPNFTAFFGFAPDYTDGSMGINGDDAVELFQSGVVIDVFGDVNVDGSGTAWDYLDGWAYRMNNMTPSTTFNVSDWSYSGINALDGETSNATATTPFPVGTYTMGGGTGMADVMITEIMYNTPSVDSFEYLEIYNNGTAAADLTGWQFSAGVDYTFGAYTLNPGDYVLVSNDSAAFFNVFGTTAFQWVSGGLSNGGEDVVLVDAAGSTIDSVNYDDAGAWPSDADGSGYSLTLCDFNTDNADPANWSLDYNVTNITIAGTSLFASPGMAGNCTPPVVIGNPYPYATIASVTGTDANGVADSLGNMYELRGVVYSPDFDGNAGYSVTVMDATGGINMFNFNDVNNYQANMGDSIHIFGTVGQFNGLTQLEVDSVALIAQNVALRSPMMTTVLDETTESKLVRINNVTLVNPAQWTGSGSGFNVDVTDGTSTFTLRIDADISVYAVAAPTGPFDVIGVGGQFDSSNPYTSGYQLFPRDTSDIIPVVAQVITANDDVVEVPYNTATTFSPLANDILPNGILSFQALSNPTNGGVTIDIVSQTVTYTPNAGFCGTDMATYEICDALGCDTAMVTFNVACPLPAYPIATVMTVDADGIADSLNVACQLTGTVYGVDFRGGTGLSFTIMDATGGINVFSFSDVSGYTVNEGDSITVEGTIDQFNGLIEMIPDTIILNGMGTLQAPTVVTTLDETTESRLVKLEAVTLVDATQWTNSGSGFNVEVRNATDTLTVRIDNDCDLFGTMAPTGWFNVTGLGNQYDSSNPYTEGYQLFPRYQADIELLTNTNNPTALAEEVTFFPNPTTGFLTVQSDVQLTRIRVSNMLGQTLRVINTPAMNTTFNVADLANGVYIITFETETGVRSQQFVKQ